MLCSTALANFPICLLFFFLMLIIYLWNFLCSSRFVFTFYCMLLVLMYCIFNSLYIEGIMVLVFIYKEGIHTWANKVVESHPRKESGLQLIIENHFCNIIICILKCFCNMLLLMNRNGSKQENSFNT